MEGNGDGVPLVVLGRRGRLRVQYDKDTPEVEIDVMLVQNQWHEIDATFRDDKNEVPDARVGAYRAAETKFTEELLQVKPGTMSWGEAEHFFAVLNAESKKLKDFFDGVSGAAPSSRASTELIFSTEGLDID